MRSLSPFLIACAVCVLSAQEPPARQTFRSGLEVLSIETSVRDAAGAPLTDLQPSDFTVRIDGEPRKVLTTRLYGRDTHAAPAAPVAAGPVANVDRPAGRAVVIAVDRNSIRAGSEQALLDTASRMLETLGPEDAVAAVSLPGAVTDFTRDHAVVAAAVRRMTGTQPASDGSHYITWPEAVAYENRDTVTMDEVIRRECTELQTCPRELSLQAHSMVITGRLRIQDLLQTLTSVIDRFGSIAAPKRFILISAGFPFDLEMVARYRDLAEKAARAHVALFVVQLDQSTFDAATRGRGPEAQVFGGRETAEGLGQIASITGGRFFGAVGKATGVFDRIAAEIASFYELGVESHPSDADGKPHKVDVKVARAGVIVTTPASTAAPRPKTRTAVEVLKAALAEPTDVTELPLEVATYMTHSTDPDKVRVIVSAAADPTAPPPALWGSVVMDGNKVAGAVGTEIDAHAAAPWSSTGIIEIPSGRYRLRTAIVSGDRVGTLDLPLVTGLRALGDARASDLIVGVVKGGHLEPRPRLSHADAALAMIELSSGAPLSDLTGSLILTTAGATDPVARTALAFRTRSDDKSVVLGESAVDLASVAPGRYTVSAIIEQGGKAIGRVSRALEVTK